MRMRKLEPRTQEGDVRAVWKLTAFLGRSRDTAKVQDLRNFRLHLVDTGTSPITLGVRLHLVESKAPRAVGPCRCCSLEICSNPAALVSIGCLDPA